MQWKLFSKAHQWPSLLNAISLNRYYFNGLDGKRKLSAVVDSAPISWGDEIFNFTTKYN